MALPPQSKMKAWLIALALIAQACGGGGGGGSGSSLTPDPQLDGVDINGLQLILGSIAGNLSDNGRWKVFSTDDDPLLEGTFVSGAYIAELNTSEQVIALQRADMQDETCPASTNAFPNGNASQPLISSNGRWVFFITDADNLDLCAPDLNGMKDLYVLDRDADENGTFDELGTRTVRRVSMAANGAELDYFAGFANQGVSAYAISADARSVAFMSDSETLLPIAMNNYAEDAGGLNVLRRDLSGDGFYDDPTDINVTLVSPLDPFDLHVEPVDPYGFSSHHSSAFSLSEFGRYVSFSTKTDQLECADPFDPLNCFDPGFFYQAYVYDGDALGLGEPYDITVSYSLISWNEFGQTPQLGLPDDGGAGEGDSFEPQLANSFGFGEGGFVAYSSFANNITPADFNPFADIMLHERAGFTVELVSTDDFGDEADGDCLTPSINYEGDIIVYQSDAGNLGDGFYHQVGLPGHFKQYYFNINSGLTLWLEKVNSFVPGVALANFDATLTNMAFQDDFGSQQSFTTGFQHLQHNIPGAVDENFEVDDSYTHD